MDSFFLACFAIGALFTVVSVVIGVAGHGLPHVEAAGQAEATRLQGTAEAEIVRARGHAEADAMHQKAAAYQEYSQAAVLDKLITGMPEIVRALAQSWPASTRSLLCQQATAARPALAN